MIKYSGDKNLMNEKSSESNTFDIYDPRIWDSLDINSKDLLIKMILKEILI